MIGNQKFQIRSRNLDATGLTDVDRDQIPKRAQTILVLQ